MAIEKWLIRPGESRVIDIEIVRALKMSLIGGQVDVMAHDGPGARLEVQSVTGRDLQISIDGDVVEIDHPQLRWDNFIEVFSSFRGSAQAEISVAVPRDLALKMGVVQASALVSGLHGDTRISSVSGDVVVDSVTGTLEVNTVSGEFSVQNHTGRISAHTVSGDIVAQGAISKFSCNSVTADVLLDVEGSADSLSVNSVSGSTTIRLDTNLGVRYRVNTVSGTVQVENQVLTPTRGVAHTGTTGAMDGHWAEVAVNSASGAVSLIRKGSSPHSAQASGSPRKEEF